MTNIEKVKRILDASDVGKIVRKCLSKQYDESKKNTTNN